MRDSSAMRTLKNEGDRGFKITHEHEKLKLEQFQFSFFHKVHRSYIQILNFIVISNYLF